MLDRIHISVFGPRNAGKSSLINALTGQEVSIVSEVAGTTTDPVAKPMELHPIGPVMITDTAGYDDTDTLGQMRVGKTKKTLHKTDVALFVIPSNIESSKFKEAKDWWGLISSLARKTVFVVNEFAAVDRQNSVEELAMVFGIGEGEIVCVNALSGENISGLKDVITRAASQEGNVRSIVSHLVKHDDVVMLVMPQDLQAPRGRLILPQVQTIRELLDNKCIVMSCATTNFEHALSQLSSPPALIVTDSQAFPQVCAAKPEGTPLTSFSVLMARLKGDINEFIQGAKAIAQLNGHSHVLIAEACTHAPLAEDIGREQIPSMLRRRFGESIKIDIVAGNDWTENIEAYDLIIHCGACMFNSAHVHTRQQFAREAGVPMTNYGVFIAAFNNIIDKIVY